ncbi:MAG: beta-lactamase family protein [Cryobacterium sp.]|nr:beta-lactamase family protein [Oligoflexia bacterium]
MKNQNFSTLLGVFAFALAFETFAASSTLGAQPTEGVSNESVMRGLQAYVNAGKTVGAVAVIVRPEGRFSVKLGEKKLGLRKLPDANTPFQIGSVSKTFTSLILSELVLEKRVRLSDPISRFFPEFSELRLYPAGSITLRELSTHTSGLPRLPENFRVINQKDPYANYTVRDLEDELRDPTLLKHVGPYPVNYSNFGAGLLGYILTRVTGLTYDEMIRARITRPLGMRDTGISLSDSQFRRKATGYDDRGNEVLDWHFHDSLIGAGGIYSTLADMTRYMEAQLRPDHSPVGEAIRFSHKLQVRGTAKNVGLPPMTDVGLAWARTVINGQQVIWHNGEVGGFYSFTGMNFSTHTGIEVLTNTADTAIESCIVSLLVGSECLSARN